MVELRAPATQHSFRIIFQLFVYISPPGKFYSSLYHLLLLPELQISYFGVEGNGAYRQEFDIVIFVPGAYILAYLHLLVGRYRYYT